MGSHYHALEVIDSERFRNRIRTRLRFEYATSVGAWHVFALHHAFAHHAFTRVSAVLAPRHHAPTRVALLDDCSMLNNFQ